MEKKTLIRNAQAIVACDASDTVFHDADLLIQGPAVLAIGKNLDPSGAEILDASGKFVYPGLVNTHHHFFQTFVRNLMTVDYPNLSVMDWIGKIYEIFKLIDSDSIYYSSLVAMADLVKHGCTCAFDHQYCFPRHAGRELVDRQMEAAALLGIRYHAGRGANTLPKSEGSTVPDEMLETTDEFLADCERLAGLYHSGKPFAMTDVVVSPCQPINCRRETFVESLAFARDRGLRLHTHLGEGENPPMLERWGKRTLAWCEDIGFVGPDIWYAHGWELTPEEYRVMAATGTGLSHCPAPAVLGGFPILDIPAMTKAGMKLGLGCDGSATNDSSNLLDSLRMAYLMQAFHSKERGDESLALRNAEDRDGGRRGTSRKEGSGIARAGQGRRPFHDRHGEAGIRGCDSRPRQSPGPRRGDGTGLAHHGEREGRLRRRKAHRNRRREAGGRGRGDLHAGHTIAKPGLRRGAVRGARSEGGKKTERNLTRASPLGKA